MGNKLTPEAASEPRPVARPVVALENSTEQRMGDPVLTVLVKLCSTIDYAATKHPELGLKMIVTSRAKAGLSAEFSAKYSAGGSHDLFRAAIASKGWYSTLMTVAVKVSQKYMSRAKFWTNSVEPSPALFVVCNLYSDEYFLFANSQRTPDRWERILWYMNSKIARMPLSPRDSATHAFFPLAEAVSDMFKAVTKVNNAVTQKSIITFPTVFGNILYNTHARTISCSGYEVNIPDDEDPIDYLPGIRWTGEMLPMGCEVTQAGGVLRLNRHEGNIDNIKQLTRQINLYLLNTPRRHQEKKTKEQVSRSAPNTDDVVTLTHHQAPRRSKALPQPGVLPIPHYDLEPQPEVENRQPHEPPNKRAKKMSRRRCRKCAVISVQR